MAETTATPGFDPLAHPMTWREPRIVPPYSWVGHIPFAFLAMELLEPRVFVELGTHSGNSYLAFCQARAELGLATACHAIDTWKGDEHSSVYGEDVYDTLRAYHDGRYAEFSTLHRTTFDEAATEFADGSVDLLHIDGYHTYEAVRHDFETWAPKLSAHAVVLFHDTAVRERGFGVWRFMDELGQRFRTIRFPHSHGLGVALVGAAVPGRFVEFVDAYERNPDAIAAWFGALGGRIEKEGARRDAEASERELRLRNERAAAPLVSQVYWASGDEPFDESRSATYALSRELLSQAASLRIPAGATRLRLDVANMPGVFELGAIRLTDAKGRLVWSMEDWSDWNAPIAGARRLGCASRRLMLSVLGEDPHLELPIDAGRVAGAGELTLGFEVGVLTAGSEPATRRTIELVESLDAEVGRYDRQWLDRLPLTESLLAATTAQIQYAVDHRGEAIAAGVERLEGRVDASVALFDAMRSRIDALFADSQAELSRTRAAITEACAREAVAREALLRSESARAELGERLDVAERRVEEQARALGARDASLDRAAEERARLEAALADARAAHERAIARAAALEAANEALLSSRTFRIARLLGARHGRG